MINGTQLVIDTGAQCCDHLQERFAASVVPLTVVIDGEAFLEHIDLDRRRFYEKLEQGAQITTAAPGPGQLLAAYRAAADAGATAVLSVHLSGNMSSTANAARVAGEMSRIPVEVLDTRITGWGVDACAEVAAEALEQGVAIEGAVTAAEEVRARLMNVFVVGQPKLLERGGRSHVLGQTFDATSVWATGPEGFVEVAKVEDVQQTVEAFVAHITQKSGPSRVRVAVGDARSPGVAEYLASSIAAAVETDDVIRYEIGPSLATHMGIGTIAATFFTLT